MSTEDEALTLEVGTHLGHVTIAAGDGTMPKLFLAPEAALDFAAKVKKAARRAMRQRQ